MRRLWPWLSVLWLACSGQLCGEPYLAELAKQRGEVQRDDARAVGRWRGAGEGDRFRVGDGLRTGPSGSAELALTPDGIALVEANTVLRFLDRDPRGAGRRIAIEEGVVRVDSGKLELDVHTAQGLARVKQGSSVRVVASGRDLSFDVLVGHVAIDQGGAQSELVAGQKLGVRATPEAPPAPPSPPAAAREPEARAVDVSLPSFEPMVVHAPSLPLTLSWPRPGCEDALETELDGRVMPDAAGADGVVLRLARAGAHRVRVVASGRDLSFDVLVGPVAIDQGGAQSELVAGQKLGVRATPEAPPAPPRRGSARTARTTARSRRTGGATRCATRTCCRWSPCAGAMRARPARIR